MILNDEEIYRRIKSGVLFIYPYNPDFIQPAGYDLHLHRDILVYAHKHVPGQAEGDISGYNYQIPDQNNSEHFLPGIIPDDGFPLYPGQCLLGRSVETFRFPNNLVGKLDGVSSNGRIFLIVHSTAGKFDPGFEGTATLEIANLSPRVTVLKPFMRIAQMEFHIMTAPAEHSYSESGRYQNQVAPTPTRDPRTGTKSKFIGFDRY